MNRYKSYNIEKISYDKTSNLIDDYLEQVNNDYLKKVNIDISGNELVIDIEPYYQNSNLWDTLVNLLKKKKVVFWFRDDDIGICDNKMFELLNYMDKKNITMLLAVIPLLLSEETVLKLSHYNNYIVGQHGYSHSNFSLTEKAEYTKDRDINEVERELLLGNKKLEKLFSKQYIKYFIPPWFNIDDRTMKLLKRLKYNGVSNYWNNKVNKYGINEINCQVDFVDWQKAYSFGGEDFVLKQIIKELESERDNYIIGLLLHHERVGKETYKFLDKLIGVIDEYSYISSFDKLVNKGE